MHRLVDAIVKKRKKKPGLSPVETIKLATHCSDTERRAADAERELTKIKLLMLLEQKRDEVFEAVISGVQKFGIFCRGTRLPVDGFIHASSLVKRDVLDFDRTTHTMTARRSGRVFRLGDAVKVRIAMVDPDERTLHWELVEGPKQGGQSCSKSKNKKGGSKPTAKNPTGKKRRGCKSENSKKSSKPKRKKSRKSRDQSSGEGSGRKRSRRKNR